MFQSEAAERQKYRMVKMVKTAMLKIQEEGEDVKKDLCDTKHFKREKEVREEKSLMSKESVAKRGKTPSKICVKTEEFQSTPETNPGH